MAVTALEGRAYRVETDLPEADGTLAWSSTTLVLAEVSAFGQVGLGWTYASTSCLSVIENELARVVVAADPLDVMAIHEEMVRSCRNLGRSGIVACAISAVDIALWDLKARLLGCSLVSLFGRFRPDVPVYGSGGFTTYDDRTAAAQLEGWVAGQGIPRVKIKIGESWGTRPERDLERVALARRVIGEGAALYVDSNGAYTAKQAIRLGRRMYAEHGVEWFEEPVSSDDLVGLSAVREAVAPDVAAGEYGYDEMYFAKMVGAGAVDCLQVDVTRCGGYTSWLRAAAIASAHGLQVSGHCAPSLHAHVGGCVSNLRHVEYFHDHTRLERILFDGILEPECGALHPDPGIPGHGMCVREADARPYRVR